jgi:hypothetical protein
LERELGTIAVRTAPDESSIVAACDKVFRARLKREQEGVLEQVQGEMLALLKCLGVRNLAGVQLAANLILRLEKGGAEINYGRLSIGDQLRCKISLVVALMKVAQQRGVGRHPGILLIDTPGAQEVAVDDLKEMASGLAALCHDLPTLQVFVATARVPEFGAVVPAERARIAGPGSAVW